MTELRRADKWTPGLLSEASLARTIVMINYDSDGETVMYWVGDENGESHECKGTTFRAWIAFMHATGAVDHKWLEILEDQDFGA